MEYVEAEKHFGSQGALALACRRAQSTVAEWKKAGAIPRGAQCELQIRTGGVLVADLMAPLKVKPRAARALKGSPGAAVALDGALKKRKPTPRRRARRA